MSIQFQIKETLGYLVVEFTGAGTAEEAWRQSRQPEYPDAGRRGVGSTAEGRHGQRCIQPLDAYPRRRVHSGLHSRNPDAGAGS
jgi:hypothetical protein